METVTKPRAFESMIFEIRGIKVMIDFDLAILYETDTKKLKQQVKRNLDRFPSDFMFELNKKEKEQIINQNPRLENLKFSIINPMVFSEQGVSMLSSVLSSKKAVLMNIEIMRAFSKYRSLILENVELKREIEKLDNKLNEAFQFLLNKLDALAPVIKERKLVLNNSSSLLITTNNVELYFPIQDIKHLKLKHVLLKLPQ